MQIDVTYSIIDSCTCNSNVTCTDKYSSGVTSQPIFNGHGQEVQANIPTGFESIFAAKSALSQFSQISIPNTDEVKVKIDFSRIIVLSS